MTTETPTRLDDPRQRPLREALVQDGPGAGHVFHRRRPSVWQGVKASPATMVAGLQLLSRVLIGGL